MASARETFKSACTACVGDVRQVLSRLIKPDATLSEAEVATLVEDYMCAVFSEIRMMANYFRTTASFFSLGPDTFRRFDYVIRRHLLGHLRVDVDEARQVVIAAIKRSADAGGEARQA